MGLWSAIKRALNSSVGTKVFKPLDRLVYEATTGEMVTFTTDGVFTVPAGVTKIWVTACGGGAGGSGSYDSTTWDNVYRGPGGGGAAAIYKQVFDVSNISEITITVGKGGSGGVKSSGSGSSNSTSTGKAGTATKIGSLITLAGGNAPSNSNGGTAGGAGGGAGGGSSLYDTTNTDGSSGVLGAGGAGKYAGGGGGSLGDGGSTSSNGGNGSYGGGGGGATSGNGGKGGDGIVLISYGIIGYNEIKEKTDF